MVIFHSYVSLPEGSIFLPAPWILIMGHESVESSVEVASDLSATGTTAGNARAAAVRWPRGSAIGGSR